ncbi:MAG: hypothetical protein OXH51_10905 [Gemmatimonadetes bacterium]|nr:hypothetical protein [Gemmatimonadota bacterium]MCY3677892.1 hypothetical protein [Gemmatimonadota bacterium]
MTGGDGRPPGVFEINTTAITARMAKSEQTMTRLGVILRGPVDLLVSVSIS